ncbi:MAG: hypothetical protein SGI71_00560 [Verrucomicrobiota bacterium]|nr:hypothetical protein [Verrucomicrobiota bacterium]
MATQLPSGLGNVKKPVINIRRSKGVTPKAVVDAGQKTAIISAKAPGENVPLGMVPRAKEPLNPNAPPSPTPVGAPAPPPVKPVAPPVSPLNSTSGGETLFAGSAFAKTKPSSPTPAPAIESEGPSAPPGSKKETTIVNIPSIKPAQPPPSPTARAVPTPVNPAENAAGGETLFVGSGFAPKTIAPASQPPESTEPANEAKVTRVVNIPSIVPGAVTSTTTTPPQAANPALRPIIPVVPAGANPAPPAAATPMPRPVAPVNPSATAIPKPAVPVVAPMPAAAPRPAAVSPIDAGATVIAKSPSASYPGVQPRPSSVPVAAPAPVAGVKPVVPPGPPGASSLASPKPVAAPAPIAAVAQESGSSPTIPKPPAKKETVRINLPPKTASFSPPSLPNQTISSPTVAPKPMAPGSGSSPNAPRPIVAPKKETARVAVPPPQPKTGTAPISAPAASTPQAPVIAPRPVAAVPSAVVPAAIKPAAVPVSAAQSATVKLPQTQAFLQPNQPAPAGQMNRPGAMQPAEPKSTILWDSLAAAAAVVSMIAVFLLWQASQVSIG